MFKRLWQKLIRFFRRFFPQKTSPPPIPPTPVSKPPLTDADYEFLFMQLLEGVNRGWEVHQIDHFLQSLSDRASMRDWVDWLQRFGDRLVASPSPNIELASRMLKLAKIGYGSLGQTAKIVGERLLAQQAHPVDQSVPLNEDAETLFNQGNEHFQAGRYQAAIASWDAALAQKPDLYQAWMNRGLALTSLRRYPEALACYEQALAINPHDDLVWSNRGVVLRHLDRNQEALDCYEKALQIQPNCFDAWVNRGALLSGSGRYPESLDSYQKAIDLKPQRYEGWYGRGMMLMALHRYSEALEAWDKGIEIKPDFQAAWCQRGVALYHLGEYAAAVTACDEAIRLLPDDPEAISYWSKARAKLQHLSEESSEQKE